MSYSIDHTSSGVTNVKVSPGTLVRFEKLGIYVNADFNAPEFGSQPYVSIFTDNLPAEHRYDSATGRRAIDPPYTAGVDQLGRWQVINSETSVVVARFEGGEYPVDAKRDAESYDMLDAGQMSVMDITDAMRAKADTIAFLRAAGNDELASRVAGYWR